MIIVGGGDMALEKRSTLKTRVDRRAMENLQHRAFSDLCAEGASQEDSP